MAKARVEFVNLMQSSNANIIKSIYGTSYDYDTAASPADEEPVVPDGYEFAVVGAVEGNIIVAWGATAAQGVGKLIMEGQEIAINVKHGQTLTFVEYT